MRWTFGLVAGVYPKEKGAPLTRMRPSEGFPIFTSLLRIFRILFFAVLFWSFLPLTIEASPEDSVTKLIVDMDLRELSKVQVSPFEVILELDTGYRAPSSVTASRFHASFMDLPFAIQAFNTSFIKDQKPNNIFDIVRYSPGVTYRSNDFNEGNANLAIRGFTVGSLAGGNIQILRDGFHGPSIFDFTNISRIEVVKGPSSFLYGQIAPGGIVNIITKKPEPEFGLNVESRYGYYNQYHFESDVTGPAWNNLYYRLATSYDHDMEYWDPYDAHSLNLSPSLLWKPQERVAISLKYEFYRKDEEPQLMQKPGYGSQTGLVPSPSDPNLSAVDVPGLPDHWNSMSNVDYRRSETNGLSSWLDFKANSHWDIRAGYSHQVYEIDAVFSGNLGMSSNKTFLQGRRFRRQNYSNDDNTFQLDAVGKYNTSWASLRMLLGAQYIDRGFDRWAGQAPNDSTLGKDPIASPLPLWDLQDSRTWNREVAIPLSNLTESKNDERTAFTDKSMNAGMTLGLWNDRLLILSGGRYTLTTSRMTKFADKQPESYASMITPQYGILYKLVDNVSLFAAYSESFVPGTFLKKNMDGTFSLAEPTYGSGCDIGVKSEWMNGRLVGTLLFFDIINKNIVNDMGVTDSTGNVTIYNIQSGEQRSRGIELDATLTASEKFQFNFSYSYMDARITQFSGNDHAILSQDTASLDAAGRVNYKTVRRFHGAPLQMSAPHLFNLWARYDLPGEWLKGAFCAGGANYIYDQTLLPDSPPSSNQTYMLASAVLGYGWEIENYTMSAEIMGKNLTSERYRPSQSTRSRPREILVSMKARF